MNHTEKEKRLTLFSAGKYKYFHSAVKTTEHRLWLEKNVYWNKSRLSLLIYIQNRCFPFHSHFQEKVKRNLQNITRDHERKRKFTAFKYKYFHSAVKTTEHWLWLDMNVYWNKSRLSLRIYVQNRCFPFHSQFQEKVKRNIQIILRADDADCFGISLALLGQDKD